MAGLLIISLPFSLVLRWLSKLSCSYFYYCSFIIPLMVWKHKYGFGVVLVLHPPFFSDGAHDTHSEELGKCNIFF